MPFKTYLNLHTECRRIRSLYSSSLIHLGINAHLNFKHGKANNVCSRQYASTWINQLDIPWCLVCDSKSIARILRECTSLSEGKCIHAYVIQNRQEEETFVDNLLVHMYAKCGNIGNGKAVFDRMKCRNIFSWTIMARACTEHGLCKDALLIFFRMQVEGLMPNKITFTVILDACDEYEFITWGRLIHAQIVASRLESDVFVGSVVVNMYSKCGCLYDACAAFKKMHVHDIYSWNAMIAGYTQHGFWKEAVFCYQQLQLGPLKPDKVTYITIVAACATEASIFIGKLIHGSMVGRDFDLETTIQNSLITMYNKGGHLEDAWSIFNRMDTRDIVSWNAMIAAYGEHGYFRSAFALLYQMYQLKLPPSRSTFATIIDACKEQDLISQGKRIHAYILALGLGANIVIGTALLHMYGKCGSLEDARAIFNTMDERNIITWNAMIAAYVDHGYSRVALLLSQQMHQQGMLPSEVTFISILDACACLQSLTQGKQAHLQIINHAVEADILVNTSLINMYSKCGSLKEAWKIFRIMTKHDAFSWRAMIAAYTHDKHHDEAFHLFQSMKTEGMPLDEGTLICLLDSCATQAALAKGSWLHEHLTSQFASDISVRIALMNMYNRCGSVTDAERVFDELHERSVAYWNAMLAVYAQHGHGKKALHRFQKMQLEGIQASHLTFVGIISACGHAGYIDEGCHLYMSLTSLHFMALTMELYNSMLDLLGRAGWLDEAEDMIVWMVSHPTSTLWMTFVGACRMHVGNRGHHCLVPT